jgi:FemAB-related protein (PEP-CTERM system-associated)
MNSGIVALEVREVDAGQQPAWDAYVATHPCATFFHQHGWQEALRELRHRPVRLAAFRGREICGVLPVALARNHRGALTSYSLPHTVYGGPLADDAEGEQALCDAALRFTARGDAGRLELRNRHPTALELPVLDGYVTFERELPSSPRALLASFNKGAQAAVSQAERSGLRAVFNDDLDGFHRLLAASYRRLGTPVYPRHFLAAIKDRFPGQVSILMVHHGERPVAGIFALRFRDSLMPLFSGDLPEARPLRAGNFKYFHLMKHAIAAGLRRFDFGRSRLSHPGVVAFKRHLGFEPIPLPYQVWPDAPSDGADPNTGAWRALRSLWRRLPSGLADRLGPVLVRRFP